jgi:hypothetical protein
MSLASIKIRHLHVNYTHEVQCSLAHDFGLKLGKEGRLRVSISEEQMRKDLQTLAVWYDFEFELRFTEEE